MISIIVPVFNVGRYIGECIESILYQSYSDWELLLIDDGSIDNGGDVCDGYASNDVRIRCFHQKNKGVTAARKIGWQNAKGKWITFVDGDDSLPKNALETLYKQTIANDSDIIEGYSYEKKDIPEILSINDYRELLLKVPGKISLSVWGKLFRKEIISEWCFDIPREVIRGEDWITNIRIAYQTEKTPILIPQKIYNYRENLESVTHVHYKNVDTEYVFFQQWRMSIPQQFRERYIYHFISMAIGMYNGCCVVNLFNTSPVDSPFAEEIRKMIKQNSVTPMLHDKVLLNSKNGWLRFFCWKIHRLKRKFAR